MAAEPKYDMTVYATSGLVRSASNGAEAHQVQVPVCDCADFINRKGQLAEIDGMPVITICKHIAEFMARAGGWKRPADPEPETAGLNSTKAFMALIAARVNGGEADRALAEAVRTGRAFAGLPGSGSVPVTYDREHQCFEVQVPSSPRH